MMGLEEAQGAVYAHLLRTPWPDRVRSRQAGTDIFFGTHYPSRT